MKKISEIDVSKKIMIAVKGSPLAVEAPLPESFGLGVSSEYTQPFEQFISDGNVASALRMTGYSNKIGLFTEQVWTGPETTTFTLELSFTAFYSAMNEVLGPVMSLMVMGAGLKTDGKQILAEMKKIYKVANVKSGGIADTVVSGVSDAIGTASEYAGDVLGVEENEDFGVSFEKASKYIEAAKAPPTVYVRLGNVMDIPNCLITEVSPEFSNVLDYQGIPMSAKVSVTFTFKRPLFANDITGMFTRVTR